MTDETTQRIEDAEEHRKSYDAIMGAATAHGVPFSLALTMFFTSWVMANGVIMSFVLAAVTYFFSHLIVKMFFSH